MQRPSQLVFCLLSLVLPYSALGAPDCTVPVGKATAIPHYFAAEDHAIREMDVGTRDADLWSLDVEQEVAPHAHGRARVTFWWNPETLDALRKQYAGQDQVPYTVCFSTVPVDAEWYEDHELLALADGYFDFDAPNAKREIELPLRPGYRISAAAHAGADAPTVLRILAREPWAPPRHVSEMACWRGITDYSFSQSGKGQYDFRIEVEGTGSAGEERSKLDYPWLYEYTLFLFDAAGWELARQKFETANPLTVEEHTLTGTMRCNGEAAYMRIVYTGNQAGG